MKCKVCVSDSDDFKRSIMEEAHYSAYAMHLVVPRCTRLSRRIISGLV